MGITLNPVTFNPHSIKSIASSISITKRVICSEYRVNGYFLLIESQINGIILPVELITLPYIAVDKRTLDSSALTMNDSPATNFIAPYNVVAALDLSEDIKQAASKLLSSAALLELIAPSIRTLTDSSTF